MATLDSDTQDQQTLAVPASSAEGVDRRLPTELLILIVSLRVLEAGPRLRADLRSLCLTSTAFKDIAEPHLYKVLSVGTPSRVLLLEQQLRVRPELCDSVKAAWWSYGYARSDGGYSRDLYPRNSFLPELQWNSAIPRPYFSRIEHVAWFFPARRRAAPQGFHCRLRDGGAWCAGHHCLSASPLDATSRTPRSTITDDSGSFLITHGHDPSATYRNEVPPRALWSAHYVVDAVRPWMYFSIRMLVTLRHVTITLFRSTRSTHRHLEKTIEDILSDCPRLQSLVIRDTRGEQVRALYGSAQWTSLAVAREVAAKLNDDRLRIEGAPSGFDWSMDSDSIPEAFTRQQWEQAVYRTGAGPWSTS